jgi:hypothetical protein
MVLFIEKKKQMGCNKLLMIKIRIDFRNYFITWSIIGANKVVVLQK